MYSKRGRPRKDGTHPKARRPPGPTRGGEGYTKRVPRVLVYTCVTPMLLETAHTGQSLAPVFGIFAKLVSF